jgi:hypothetical protein
MAGVQQDKVSTGTCGNACIKKMNNGQLDFDKQKRDGLHCTKQAEERHAQLLASCADEDFSDLEMLGFLQVCK